MERLRQASSALRLGLLRRPLQLQRPAGLPAAAPVSTQAPSQKHPVKFRYTLDNDFLSPEQRKFYEENGYLVIRKLVSEEDIKRFSDQFLKICSGQVTVPMLDIVRQKSLLHSEDTSVQRAVLQVVNFQEDKELFRYCSLPQILQYTECFIGPNISAVHTMVVNKGPDFGNKTTRHPMHQDFFYFPFRATDRIITAWTAMGRTDRMNGCLAVLPGSHKDPLKNHEVPKLESGINKLYHGVCGYDKSVPRVHLEMEKGDTVFLHPLLTHGSGCNRTKGFRMAIVCLYVNSDYGFDKERDFAKVTNDVLRKRKRMGSLCTIEGPGGGPDDVNGLDKERPMGKYSSAGNLAPSHVGL